MVKSGLLLIDKPQGLTSFDVVNIVRRRFNIRKVGHAGTLDPLATGLLIILVEGATKQFRRFVNYDKEYTAVLKLGESTDSGDSNGKITGLRDYKDVTEERAVSVLKGMEGSLETVPPMVSALHHKGKRLYELARKGIVVERSKRVINIYKLDLISFNLPFIEFSLTCSKGTYVRSLAEEIALRLNTVGHIIRIRRSSIGNYDVSMSRKIDNFNENDILPC